MPRTRAAIEANLIRVAAELRARRNTGHSDSRHVDLLLADADTLLDEWLAEQSQA